MPPGLPRGDGNAFLRLPPLNALLDDSSGSRFQPQSSWIYVTFFLLAIMSMVSFASIRITRSSWIAVHRVASPVIPTADSAVGLQSPPMGPDKPSADDVVLLRQQG